MNDRIKELAEQAGFETDRGPCISPSPYIKVGGLNVGVPLEKFAQLLITETIKELCQQMYCHGIDLSNYPKFHTIIEKKTKDHFGVE